MNELRGRVPMHRTANVFLVGMPGSGKTTIGKMLAKDLHWTFLDTDTMIEEQTGVTIATIFDMEGEAGFRRRETAVIARVARSECQVVATGGGAVLSEANRHCMRRNGQVVYLQATRELLLRRIRNDRTRPLLQGDEFEGKLDALMVLRTPIYESICDFSVASSQRPPMQVAKEIRGRLDFDTVHGFSASPVPGTRTRK